MVRNVENEQGKLTIFLICPKRKDDLKYYDQSCQKTLC